MNDDVLLIDEKEAARILDLSPRTLQRWRCTGQGPSFTKLGKAVKYTRGDLDAFVERSRRTSTAAAAA